MVHAALRRSLKSKHGLQGIPPKFTLNTGHVKFFYDKGEYLHKRYGLLIEELQKRGFKLDPSRAVDWTVFKDNDLYNDWSPTAEDQVIILQRIHQKIAMKRSWYRYYGKPI